MVLSVGRQRSPAPLILTCQAVAKGKENKHQWPVRITVTTLKLEHLNGTLDDGNVNPGFQW